MKSSLSSFCKIFNIGLKLTVVAFILLPVFVKAQTRKISPHRSLVRQITIQPTSTENLRTTGATTCPTGPVSMTGEDAVTGATINSGQTLACGSDPFYVFSAAVAVGAGIPAPCIGTLFTDYHNNLATAGSETIYEGGVPIFTLCPACASGPIGGGTAFGGLPWAFDLYNLDPSQSHEFVFCRSGNITTNTVTLTDCWTGNTLASTPPSDVFSNATTTVGGTCDTLKLPAGSSIGTASFSIAPASGAPGLIDLNDGAAYIYTDTLSTGTYTVAYTFNPPDGCPTVTGTFIFTIGPAITVTVPSHTVCAGTNATLTATGHSGTAPYTFSWTPTADLSATTGSPVTVINPTVTTIYTVTAMDGGCSATATSTVTVNNIPTFSVNSIAICGAGANDTLTAVGNATTYSWTPSTGLSATSGSTVTATPTVTTTYTITGKNGTCSSTETSTVTITSSPTMTVNSATVCAGGTATLTASGATTYTWSSTSVTYTATGNTLIDDPSATTTYTITGSAGSCSVIPATATITVNPIATLTVNSAAICTPGTATLTASGATTYSWIPSTGLSATTGSMVVANPTVTTTYTITGTTGGCSSIGTSTVGVFSVPSFTVNPVTMCSGQPATLIGSDNTLSYTWTPAATTTVSATTDTAWVSPPSTTVYTITGANAGCPPLSITDSVIVKLSPTIAVLSPTVCTGTSATITATGATSYTWTPLTNLTTSITNDTVYVNTPTVSTSYTVMGTGADGCVSMAVSTVDVSNYLGILSGTPVIVCYGNTISLGAVGASTYTWTSNDPANLNFGLDTSWSVTASVANVGTYSVYIYGESHSGNFCKGYDTITVTINPTPTVTAVSPTNTAVCLGSSVVLTATSVPSGTLAVTYNWSPSTGLSATTGNTVTATPTVTTVYLATGSYTTGCSANATFTVNVIPIPSFTVTSAPICEGNSTPLVVIPTTTLSGAGTYTWSPATGLSATTGTNVTANPSTPGINTYTVIGVNTYTPTALTCTNIATSTVVVIPLPTVTVTPPSSICLGSTDTLKAGGAVTYTWSTSSITYTVSGLNSNLLIDGPTATTVYTVTGTGSVGGCTNTATTTLTVNPIPTFTLSNSNPAFCIGGSSTLTAVPTSTVTLAAPYTWTPATGLSTATGTNVTAIPSVTTNYTVNATSTAGCPYTQVTTVTVHTVFPLSITPSSTTICNGSSTTLTTNNGLMVYTWMPTAAISGSTNTATVVASPTVTTTYSVTGQDAFGCSYDTATAIVTVITVTASANSNSPVCKGQTINLISNSATGNSWAGPNSFTSNSQTPNISNVTNANSGTYTLTITIGSCFATNTVNVIVNPNPIVSVAPSNTTICPGAAYTYTASSISGNLSYTWTPSSSLSSATGSVVVASPSSTTIYSVTGTDANGCSSAPATATLNVNPVIANMSANPETGIAPLNVQFTNLSTNANSYVWNYGNGNGQTTISLTDTTTKTTYTTGGTYLVILTASNTQGGNTCTDKDTLTIIVTEAYSIIIPNIFTPNGDAINDNFMVKTEGVSSLNILIYDRWGLKMFESGSITGAWDGKTAGGKEVPDDTYFYIINATDNKGKNNEYKGFITLLK